MMHRSFTLSFSDRPQEPLQAVAFLLNLRALWSCIVNVRSTMIIVSVIYHPVGIGRITAHCQRVSSF